MNIRFTDSSTGTTDTDGILFGKDNCNNAFISNLDIRGNLILVYLFCYLRVLSYAGSLETSTA